MAQRKQTRYEKGEDEYSARSENQEQYQLSYDPPWGGGASSDLSLDSSVDCREAGHYSRNYIHDSRSRGAVEFDPSYASSTSSMTYSDKAQSLVIHGRGNDNMFDKELSSFDPSNVDQIFRKKWYQKCRLCVNHNIDVFMKGHKHFCPYSKCVCTMCGATRNRQCYSKEKQRHARRLEKETMYHSTPTVPQVQSRDYPDCLRRQMGEDLADLDLTGLDEIKELCKRGNKNRKEEK